MADIPSDFALLTAEMCKDLTPRMFVINHTAGERLSPKIARLLDPIDQGSFIHMWLPRERATALHHHENDEYWGWTKGQTLVTVVLPDGQRDRFEISQGWVVYCVRGMCHGHDPLEDWGAYEWRSVLRPGARAGMLYDKQP